MPHPFHPAQGQAFDDADVARCYACRPPYAPALIEALVALAPRRRSALDLGCGPGKLAGALAPHFESVTALDPSAPMLAEGRAAHPAGNITWLHASDAGAPLDQPFDLVTAAAAIHFMDQASLFPRLADTTPIVAIVGGDEPSDPPWKAPWREAMDHWLRRVGRTPNPAGFHAFGHRHEAWIDIHGRQTFTFDFTQSVEDYITCQHSRGTWSRAVMGAELAAAFDADLTALLTPFAIAGQLTYTLVTEVTWGAPRRTPRERA